ncbi:MMPL family transporter [Hephaestia mangrovi]|uniref:hopanoid transporter HpnN n=1 Tax=Hephaestia mangrovi TaxID=2873268 RepID=UPI001CA72562|nr:MMPL family transporter [Hephaestia mangrovi]MBY8828111.1 MMPL family transporter [Hephaestia mangrovi]
MRNPVPRAVGAAVARPWATLAAALVLAMAAIVYVAGHFAMTTDTAELISPTVPWRVHERAMDDAFPQLRDSMLVVVDGKTPELAEDGAARLAAALAADHAHFRNVSRPDGGDFFAREGLLYGSVKEVNDATAALIKAQPLLGPLAADPSLRGVATSLESVLDGVDNGSASLSDIAAPMRALAETTNRVLAGQPAYFSWQRLFASGGGALNAPTRRLVLVRPVLDYGSLTPGAAAGDAVQAAAEKLGITEAHGQTVRLTGDVPLSDEDFSSLQENIGLVGAVMLAAMLVTLWFATRSARLVIAIMATIVLGLVITLAIGLAAVGRLNLISIAFIPLFVGLGVDFGIQICVRFTHERAQGATTPVALAQAAAALGAPLTLAAGAIFLGFGAFLPTAYVGIAELGIIAGIGMVIALAMSITLLPALVTLLDPRAPNGEVGFRGLAPVDRFLERRRGAVLGAFVLAMVVSIALLPMVVFDFNPMHLRDPNGPAMQTIADLTHDPDRTPNTIGVLATDAAHARKLAAALSALPQVRQVAWLDGFVPDDQQAKLAAISDASMLLDLTLNPFDVAPPPNDAERVAALSTLADRLTQAAAAHPGPAAGDARRLATAFARMAHGTPAQRATLDAALSKPLAVMLDQVRLALQAQPVSLATLPPALVRDWRTPDGRYRLEVFPAGNASDNHVLERFRTAVAKVTPDISGLPVVTQAAASTIAGAFVQAGVIAFVLVSLLLLAVLRNAREVAFTLAPVILSIFLTLGTCVVIGQPINFANIIAFPLLFGVGVAFHIYFVMAWRGGATDLLQSSLARAVLFSALATGTAFGSLWLSHHPGTASMGKILMISLIWTLICALIFEPALLGPPIRRDRPAGR